MNHEIQCEAVWMDEDTVTTLNDLIKVCVDSKLGYLQAADRIWSRPYKTMLAEYACQRDQFASELSTLVNRLGFKAETSGMMGKALQRSRLEINGSVGGGNTGAVLDGCEHGESIIQGIYEEALKKPLPENIYRVIRHQYDQIYRAHYRIRNLKNVYQNL